MHGNGDSPQPRNSNWRLVEYVPRYLVRTPYGRLNSHLCSLPRCGRFDWGQQPVTIARGLAVVGHSWTRSGQVLLVDVERSEPPTRPVLNLALDLDHSDTQFSPKSNCKLHHHSYQPSILCIRRHTVCSLHVSNSLTDRTSILSTPAVSARPSTSTTRANRDVSNAYVHPKFIHQRLAPPSMARPR